MRILILGGTSFVGPHVVCELAAQGHELTLFHRGQTEADLPRQVSHVHGDFADFDRHIDALRAREPEVVIDMVPFRAQDAERVLRFVGVAERSVVLSSCDVYRAFGRVVWTESGDPDPVPLTEDSPLRQKLSIGGENYNKTAVERIAAGDPRLPCTILRLPAIHGPGDRQHRLYPYARRIADRRPAILIDQVIADWHWMRGYVQNVAHAVALAATNPKAAGRIYNVADEPTYTEMAWVKRIATAVGYKGRIIAVSSEYLPSGFRQDIDARQQMIVNTARIRTELGYAPVVPEDEALRETFEWEISNPPLTIDPGEFDYAAEDALLKTLN